MSDASTETRVPQGLAGQAFRALAYTVLGMFALGLLLAGVSYYLLRSYPVYAPLAAGLAVVEAIIAGVVLGSQRSLIRLLVCTLQSMRLGRSVVRNLFQRVVPAGGEEQPVKAVGAVVRTVEQLPLAQAEARLNQAVCGMLASKTPVVGRTGRLSGRLQTRLLALVQKYTLARFRREGAEHGGVDLAKVQAELEARIDEVLVERLQSTMQWWTVLWVAGLTALVLAQALVLPMLLQ